MTREELVEFENVAHSSLSKDIEEYIDKFGATIAWCVDGDRDKGSVNLGTVDELLEWSFMHLWNLDEVLDEIPCEQFTILMSARILIVLMHIANPDTAEKWIATFDTGHLDRLLEAGCLPTHCGWLIERYCNYLIELHPDNRDLYNAIIEKLNTN